MTQLIYGVLLGIRLALPAAEEWSEAGARAYTARAVEFDESTTLGSAGATAGLESFLAGGQWVETLVASSSALPLLTQLVEQNTERLACILRASLDAEGRPLTEIEAGGYIGGEASTVMVHAGSDHYLAQPRPHRVPHIHVWPPPPGALAWVHTHHPARDRRPSRNDLEAAARMHQQHRQNLPFLVITPLSITAYWHGHTLDSVAVAGRGWADGVGVAECPRVHNQPA